jgi:DNA processing protein
MSLTETAAVVALLRAGRHPQARLSGPIEELGSATALLEEEHGLLASELVAEAIGLLERWASEGLHPVTILDTAYPGNLRAVHDRPPLVFVAGALRPEDARAVAVIGSRRATGEGLAAASAIAEHLVAGGYTVVSGLARGIDHAAHTRALAAGGRTVAVIGTGIRRCYPPEHADLQRRLAAVGAVVSQFLPDQLPTRDSFPMRNAVMSGLALATVIVEAGRASGARVQARCALAHGRPVFVRRELTAQPWGRELAARPGVHVISTRRDVTRTIERLTSNQALTA